MVGRGLRPWEGKTDCLVLDHAGAHIRHGFVEDPVEWTLSPDVRTASSLHKERSSSNSSRLIECCQCSAFRVRGECCPECGFLPKAPPRHVPHVEGNLSEIYRDKTRKLPNNTPEDRHTFRAMLKYDEN